MKIPWGKILRVAGEIAIDLIRGKLERKTEPPRALPRADAARQSRYARMAGPQCPRVLPTGERCGRYAGHAGRCAFTARPAR